VALRALNGFVWTFTVYVQVLSKILKMIYNSVAVVRERTIRTERLSLVDVVSTKFCGYRSVA
jgi:hypothetical protein